MKPHPEDGSLEKITSSGLNSEFNVIIIQRTDEFEEPGVGTYTFATLDRTREGIEWPGDKILENLIPELPKVKTPKVNKPDVVSKTDNLHSHHVERRFYQKPVRKRDFATTRRLKLAQKKLRSERTENTSSVNDIDPWVCKPWENQTFFPPLNTTSVSATSLISSAPFNNFYIPTSASSSPLPPITNNIFNDPNNSTFERNIRPVATPNNSFINNHKGFLNQPPPSKQMPVGPRPSFPLPNRFSLHPDRGFCGSDSIVDLNGPSRNTGLLGEAPAASYQIKHGLLGDGPFPSMPFNRNLVMFPNNLSAQSKPGESTSTLLPRDEENVGEENLFTKNSSSIDFYDRIPRSNFDQHKDNNEISGKESCDSYDYLNDPDESINNSFRNVNGKNYSMYHNSGTSVNYYENKYQDSYSHLGQRTNPKNNKNSSLKNSRNSHTTNYGEYKKPSLKVNHSFCGYKVAGNNLCNNSYKGSQIARMSKNSRFMNNRNRNLKGDSLIHISDSAVVYDPEDFQNDGCFATATNSSTLRSNLRQTAKSNFGKNKRGKYKKFQGQHRFKWRTAQK